MTRSGSQICLPRWSTRRRAERPTWGPAIGKIAKGLGWTLMPWQQHVADVALEVDPDTGRLAYRDVRITVSRQSGKTTLLLPVVVWRAFAVQLLGGRQIMVYSAQTGNDAKQKLRDDYVATLNAARAMRGRYSVRMQSGDEHVKFSSGSMLKIVPTTDKAGHSKTIDMPIQDEAWALVDNRMDQALRPPMLTRPQPQFWIPSTAGHAGSVYLRRKVNEGRVAVEADSGRGTAYFEWSADEDADPEDPATWWSCMPALGFTQTEETIQHELNEHRDAMPEFRRAYLNQWVDEIVESVIPLVWWRSRHDPVSAIEGHPVLVVDVSPDRSSAAVVAAGASTTVPGAVHLEIVNHGSGTDWCVPRLLDLWQRWSPRAVVFDDAGGATSFEQPLREAGVTVLKASTRHLVKACGQLYDAARDGGVAHTGDPRFEAALRGAATRQLQDAWAWKRRSSSSDITPLVAATLALWAHGEVDEGVVPWVAFG